MAGKKRDPIERFWQKVDKNGPLWNGTPCWIWTAGKFKQTGYGQFNPTHGSPTTAHRFSWELSKGRIPEGLVVDHLCRNRACVNPGHLEPVTDAVNVLRGETIPAKNRLKTHCSKGHEFTKKNTRLCNGGRGRQCRTCYIERARQWRIQQKTA